MFSSKSFIVSGLTFRSLIYFELIFVYGVSYPMFFNEEKEKVLLSECGPKRNLGSLLFFRKVVTVNSENEN